MKRMPDSPWESSMSWPRPERRRCRIAAARAQMPNLGAMTSVYGPQGPQGGRSGQPVMACSPTIAAACCP